MKIKLLTMSTTPSKEHNYWQVVFLPTVAMFIDKNREKHNHVAINFEWLFWSLTILINIKDDDERPVYFN